jgi:hypothetical protein
MMMRSRAFAILIGASVFAAPAMAGEVTGGKNPKPTAVRDHANSICAFSGKEDGTYLAGFDGEGRPIFLPTPTGPGLVQTPSHETSPGIDHEPGVAGDSCRGGSW